MTPPKRRTLDRFFESEDFDKKFIFLPDTLIEKNLTLIPVLEKQGILIN